VARAGAAAAGAAAAAAQQAVVTVAVTTVKSEGMVPSAMAGVSVVLCALTDRTSTTHSRLAGSGT